MEPVACSVDVGGSKVNGSEPPLALVGSVLGAGRLSGSFDVADGGMAVFCPSVDGSYVKAGESCPPSVVPTAAGIEDSEEDSMLTASDGRSDPIIGSVLMENCDSAAVRTSSAFLDVGSTSVCASFGTALAVV